MSFKERLLETLKRLLTSGKVLTALAGLIVTGLARRGVVLSPEDVNQILVLFGGLLLSQGAADLGKNAAIVKAEAPPAPEQTQTVNVIDEK